MNMVARDIDEKNHGLISFSIVKDGPYEFVLDLIDEKIIVVAVIEGGIIQKHGGVRAGDEIVSVNEIKFHGRKLESIIEELELLMENESISVLEFKIIRNSSIVETCHQSFKQILEVDEENEEVTSL